MALTKLPGCFANRGAYSYFTPFPHSFSTPVKLILLQHENMRRFSQSLASTASNHRHSHNYKLEISYGPSVRLLLSLYGMQAEQVKATGPHGRLLKGDVLQYITLKKLEPMPIQAISAPVSIPPSTDSAISSSTSASTLEGFASTKPSSVISNVTLETSEDFIDKELSNMRKTIAKRLTQSKGTIPHIYASVDCTTNKLTETRKQLARDGVKISVNDLIVKACALALQRTPAVNCRLSVNNEVEMLSTIDIAVAVATDTGLITPIVPSANEMSVCDISSMIRELAARGKEGKLQPQEFQGGSLTVSNLGMFGIREFKAVINPPQSCILAVGASQLSLNEGGKPTNTINISLACDGRIIDEVTASKFMSTLKELLENPSSMSL